MGADPSRRFRLIPGRKHLVFEEGTGWLRAQVKQTRGLTRQHNHALKDIFKGAATTIITQAPDDPLYHDYERATQAGLKPNLAKLTLARKIASTALALWKKEETYRPKHRTAPETERGA